MVLRPPAGTQTLFFAAAETYRAPVREVRLRGPSDGSDGNAIARGTVVDGGPFEEVWSPGGRCLVCSKATGSTVEACDQPPQPCAP